MALAVVLATLLGSTESRTAGRVLLGVSATVQKEIDGWLANFQQGNDQDFWIEKVGVIKLRLVDGKAQVVMVGNYKQVKSVQYTVGGNQVSLKVNGSTFKGARKIVA